MIKINIYLQNFYQIKIQVDRTVYLIRTKIRCAKVDFPLKIKNLKNNRYDFFMQSFKFNFRSH